MIADQEGRVLFSHKELACRGSGVVRFAPGFAEALRTLRLAYGRPMVVTSCCRSAAHNRKVGGHPRSLHVYDDPAHPTGGTAAIDIAAVDGATKLAILAAAIPLGWSVGVAGSFVHLDRRADFGLPAAAFTYGIPASVQPMQGV